MGNYSEALPILQRALAIAQQTLGYSHPDIATGLTNLAKLYENMDNNSEALSISKRALAIAQQTLGPFHSKTLIIQETTHRLEQIMKTREK